LLNVAQYSFIRQNRWYNLIVHFCTTSEGGCTAHSVSFRHVLYRSCVQMLFRLLASEVALKIKWRYHTGKYWEPACIHTPCMRCLKASFPASFVRSWGSPGWSPSWSNCEKTESLTYDEYIAILSLKCISFRKYIQLCPL